MSVSEKWKNTANRITNSFNEVTLAASIVFIIGPGVTLDIEEKTGALKTYKDLKLPCFLPLISLLLLLLLALSLSFLCVCYHHSPLLFSLSILDIKFLLAFFLVAAVVVATATRAVVRVEVVVIS